MKVGEYIFLVWEKVGYFVWWSNSFQSIAELKTVQVPRKERPATPRYEKLGYFGIYHISLQQDGKREGFSS